MRLSISSLLSSIALLMFSGVRASLSVCILVILNNYSDKLPLFAELSINLVWSWSSHVSDLTTSNMYILPQFRAKVSKNIFIFIFCNSRSCSFCVIIASSSLQGIITSNHHLSCRERLFPAEYIGLSDCWSKVCLHSFHCIESLQLCYLMIFKYDCDMSKGNQKMFPASILPNLSKPNKC